MGDRLPGICRLRLDGRRDRLCGLGVQRCARAQGAGRMDGVERRANLYLESRATRPLYAKVDDFHQPHHRHHVQEDGAQGEEPVGR